VISRIQAPAWIRYKDHLKVAKLGLGNQTLICLLFQ
jgi:hypothetical protein